MIRVEDIHKRFLNEHGTAKWVLRGINLTIPLKCNLGLIGANGAGKSTLLRLIGGIDQPTRGRIERQCRVSWPLGLAGGLQGNMSGRQNAKFVCRLHGHEADIKDRIDFIKGFSELADAFEDPIRTYSSGMQAKLRFALSLAFEFDIYLVDELTAVGDAAFKRKSKQAFQNLVNKSGLVMVSHDERSLKDFCQVGVWLNQGQAHWFDNIDEALVSYRESQVP